MKMQFTFDATQVAPDTGEGGGFIPASSDPRGTLVAIINAGDGNGNLMVTNSKQNGAFMPLTLKVLEGPDAGKEGVMRLNLQHEKPDTVMRAYAEMSAILHCTGIMRIQQDIREIFNKPFRVVSELQDASKPDGYTQLARGGIRDINGNKAGKAGQQAQVAQPAQQQPNANQGGGGWGQGGPQQQQPNPPQQPGNWGAPDPNANQPQNNPPQQPQGGGGWNPNAGNGGGMQQQPDPNAGGPGNWGGGAPQNAPQGGGAPNWGAAPQGGGQAPWGQ